MHKMKTTTPSRFFLFDAIHGNASRDEEVFPPWLGEENKQFFEILSKPQYLSTPHSLNKIEINRKLFRKV